MYLRIVFEGEGSRLGFKVRIHKNEKVPGERQGG